MATWLNIMQPLYEKILFEIGEDPQREGLRDTPRRMDESMRFLTKGYHESLDTILQDALFASDINEMVIVKEIDLYSLCEHHLLPFFGKCHIGYLPDGKVLGFSKIAHIVEHFARRLQLQERLTSEIATVVADITQARGVAVVIEARHLCMMMRGVEKQNAIITTSVMLGIMRENSKTRSEFLQLIK